MSTDDQEESQRIQNLYGVTWKADHNEAVEDVMFEIMEKAAPV